ncbi:MAG: CMD domain protein [Caldilineaceae bacterium]
MAQEEGSSPAVATEDLMNKLAGIQPDAPLAEVRARRPDVVIHTQGSYDTLLAPADTADLTLAERALAALRVAWLTPNGTLIHHYQKRLAQLEVADATVAAVTAFPAGAPLEPRLVAILHHVDRLTLEPVTATAAHVAALRAAGLSVRAIVALSQLIAFVSYQARVLSALHLLDAPSAAGGAEGPQQPPRAPLADGSSVHHWTMEALDWAAWLPTLDIAAATPAQIAVLEESTPTAKSSPYYLLLVQEVDALRERSKLYNAIMYGPRGLRRADRELGAVATSRVNGCVYCASVHAQRYSQLTKQPEVIQHIFDEGIGAELEPRQRAVVAYAAQLTRTPAQMTPADLAPLRAEGLDDGDILDLTNAVAMFAWANRLMLTLGEPVHKAVT